MKLYARMVPMAARGLLRKTIDPREPLRTRFRVLPHDLDINMHLNNGRYLQIVDVNRLEWLLRTRILQTAIKHRWRPVLGSCAILFRREMRMFSRGIVQTQLLGWDDRWFFLQHRVESREGRCLALCMAKAAFRSGGQWVPTQRMCELIAPNLPRPQLPDYVLTWQTLDDQLAALAMPAAPAQTWVSVASEALGASKAA